MASIEEILELEQLERDIFRGIVAETMLPRTFGGQVAGQALVSAVRTVDPRTRDDRPAPPRTLPIDSAQNPTASAPQGALPDPYANPR